MRSIYFLLVVVAAWCNSSCSLIPDLKRDNPLDGMDSTNTPYQNADTATLKLISVKVLARYPKDSTQQSNYQIVRPGDNIYFQISLKNNTKDVIESLQGYMIPLDSGLNVVPKKTNSHLEAQNSFSYYMNPNETSMMRLFYHDGTPEIINNTTFTTQIFFSDTLTKGRVMNAAFVLKDHYNEEYFVKVPFTIQ